MPLILALFGCPFVGVADIDAALDRDGDGFIAEVHGGADCDDDNASRYPGAPDPWYDGVLLDCRRTDDFDADGDGVPRDADCDDNDPEVTVETAWYVDADLDSSGTGGALIACDPGPGWAATDDDCDDDNSNLHPRAQERCNGVDDDCDGFIDDDDPDVDPDGFLRAWEDRDGDGVGSGTDIRACDPPVGWSDTGDDCDDDDPNNTPRGYERCDGVDNDCDGLVDADDDNLDPDEATWYLDLDADGWGDADAPAPVLRCLGNPDESALPGDCDDDDPTLNPGAPERCDGIDNDCDGLRDDADPDAVLPIWFYDGDGDGVGDDDLSAAVCIPPTGYVSVGGDCDDTDATQRQPISYFEDLDLDGYGGAVGARACEPVAGLTDIGGDCNDDDDTIRPGVSDPPYDGIDQDCSGTSDFDADGDGQDSDAYGGLDCNDDDPATYDGAPERYYDGIDQDCRGGSDYDADVDGQDAVAYGGTDCDDLEPTTYLGAPEVFGDGIDQDCGIVDDLDVDGDGLPDMDGCTAITRLDVPGDAATLDAAFALATDCTEIVLAPGDWPAANLDGITRRLLVRTEEDGVRLLGTPGEPMFRTIGFLGLAGLEAQGGAELVEAGEARVVIADVYVHDSADEYPVFFEPTSEADLWIRYSRFEGTEGVARAEGGGLVDIRGLTVTGADNAFYVLYLDETDLVLRDAVVTQSDLVRIIRMIGGAVDISGLDIIDNEADPFYLGELTGSVEHVRILDNILPNGESYAAGISGGSLLLRDIEMSNNFLDGAPLDDRVLFVIRAEVDGLQMVGNSFPGTGVRAVALSASSSLSHFTFVGNLVEEGLYCFLPVPVSFATLAGNLGDAVNGDAACELSHAIVAHNLGYGLSAVPGVRYANVYGNDGGDFVNMVNPVGVNGNVAVDPGFQTFDIGLPPAYMDVHLRADSVLRDAGDPALLDVDGTIADLGAYAGPGGEDDLLDLELDGMPDAWERRTGLDPLADDAGDDLDEDGLSNLDEYLLGTRPDVPDTDADQVLDINDAAPLDELVQ